MLTGSWFSNITLTSHGASLRLKQTAKLRITSPFWGGSTSGRWIHFIKVPLWRRCFRVMNISVSLQWFRNECDGVSNQQPHDCLLACLFRRISKKTSTLRVTGLCEGNLPAAGEFPTQMASNAEFFSIWWCHHGAPGCKRTSAGTTMTTVKSLI